MKRNCREDSKITVKKQLSLALYGATSRLIRQHRPFLEPLGITYPQFLVMMTLYETSPRTVGDIGQTLGMDNGTLTPLLKRLVKAGFVTRERDPADERRVLIDLTGAGKAIRTELKAVTGKVETACRLSEQELKELRDTLDGLGLPPNKQ